MQVNLYILHNVPFAIKCISALNEDWYAKANETVPTNFCEAVDRVNTNGEYASPAIQHMKVIVDWIYSKPDVFDPTKIFVEKCKIWRYGCLHYLYFALFNIN